MVCSSKRRLSQNPFQYKKTSLLLSFLACTIQYLLHALSISLCNYFFSVSPASFNYVAHFFSPSFSEKPAVVFEKLQFFRLLCLSQGESCSLTGLFYQRSFVKPCAPSQLRSAWTMHQMNNKFTVSQISIISTCLIRLFSSFRNAI